MASATIQRPRVFLDIQVGPEYAGRIIIELFIDKTPKTCDNFRALCTSSYTPPNSSSPLTYALSPFHRIIDEFMIQGGDITSGNGTGGQSIYASAPDETFEDENLEWRGLDAKGLVCMANRGPNTNTSQFFITLDECSHLNGRHTVFGHVVGGMEVVDQVAKVEVDDKDRPIKGQVVIARCGELEKRKKIGLDKFDTNKAIAGAKKLDETQDQSSRHRRGRSNSSPSPSQSEEERSKSRLHHSPPNSQSRSRSPRRRHHHHHRHHHRRHHYHSPSGEEEESSTTPRKYPRRSDHDKDSTFRGRTPTRSPSYPTQASSRQESRQQSRQGYGQGYKRNRSSSRDKYRRRSRSPRRWEGRGTWRGRGGAWGGGRRWGWEDRSERGSQEGRLGGAGDLGGGEGGQEEVKFKGRGRMMYRERKW